MHRLIAVLAVVAVAYCDVSHLSNQPQPNFLPRSTFQGNYDGRPSQHVVIPILSRSQDVRQDGSFNWGYEGANGIMAQEQGLLRQTGPEESENVVQGQYKYQSPEGETVFAKYIADKYGFRIVEGSHIPTPPPVSGEILKSLQYNAAHPEEEARYERKSFEQDGFLRN